MATARKKKGSWLRNWVDREKAAWGKIGDYVVPKISEAADVPLGYALLPRSAMGAAEGAAPKEERLGDSLLPKEYNPDVTRGLGNVKKRKMPPGVPNAQYNQYEDAVYVPNSALMSDNIRDKVTNRYAEGGLERAKSLGSSSDDTLSHEMAHAMFSRMSRAEKASFRKSMEDARKAHETGSPSLNDKSNRLNRIVSQKPGRAYFKKGAAGYMDWLGYAIAEKLMRNIGFDRLTNEEYAMINELYFDDRKSNPLRHYYSGMYRD